MHPLYVALGAVAAIIVPASASAATGDILVKLKGGYEMRSGSSAVAVVVGGTPVVVTPTNGVAIEGSLTMFVSEHVAIEGALRGTSYDLDDAAGRTLASSGLIQPSVMIEYHFSPEGRMLRPYVGVGASYMRFYDEKPGEILTNQNSPLLVNYAAALAGRIVPAAKLGLDIAVDKQLYLTLEGAYVLGGTKLTITQGVDVKTLKHDVRVIGLSAGVGFRF